MRALLAVLLIVLVAGCVVKPKPFVVKPVVNPIKPVIVVKPAPHHPYHR